MERIRVELDERSYDIEVEAGSLKRLGSFVRGVLGKKPGKAAVVTTTSVAGLYLDTAIESLSGEGYAVVPVVIPDGEGHKTIAVWESIISRLIEERFERSSAVVALGGGVVGDVAGFAAAAFLRGVPFIQAPTTIVAQVDSSIGGKVAVNHPLGKNLIGCFHQPRGVLADTRTLRSLTRREAVSGMGEAVKHAVIRDERFFTFLETHIESILDATASDDIMERFIAWNCRIKAAVVSADERESGVRAILNYGHTAGHALETETGYGRFAHGAAVMLGMIAAGDIAVARGLFPEADFERQNALLVRAGAEGNLSDITPRSVLDVMRRDKKVTDGHIRFVLPSRIGDVAVYNDVTDDEILKAVRHLRDRFGSAGSGM